MNIKKIVVDFENAAVGRCYGEIFPVAGKNFPICIKGGLKEFP